MRDGWEEGSAPGARTEVRQGQRASGRCHQVLAPPNWAAACGTSWEGFIQPVGGQGQESRKPSVRKAGSRLGNKPEFASAIARCVT